MNLVIPVLTQEVKRIVNMTPEVLREEDEDESVQQQQVIKKDNASFTVLNGSFIAGKESRGSVRRLGLVKKSALRRSSASTDPTEEETLTSTRSQHTQSSLETIEDSSGQPQKRHLFYKTPSQRRLQTKLLQPRTTPTSLTTISRSKSLSHSMSDDGDAESSSSSLLSQLRLEEEVIPAPREETSRKQGIDTARRNLSSMRRWKTPYDIDFPQRVRLASTRSLESTSTDYSSNSTISDPMLVEQQIWKGIEALMADAFSENGSVQTEDVLPPALLRAMSDSSVSSGTELTDKDVNEIQMAQAALNSFMDMLLPEHEQALSSPDTMPSLETVYDDSDPAWAPLEPQGSQAIAMAELALHNFMDVLLHDLEQDYGSSNSSSKVQILDLFRWSLKVNVDAQEKIRYLEKERQRLETERQEELRELLETERRLEQERARRQMEEQKRRQKIQKLELQLAEEQRALQKANSKAYQAMRKNQHPRESPIPDQWDATPGGKPVVINTDEANINMVRVLQPTEPTTAAATTTNAQQRQQQHLHSSGGEISADSDQDMRYLHTEPSRPPKIPVFEIEGTLPREGRVRRTPSWTMIGEKRIVMATNSIDSVSEGDSYLSNHLPSSFHEADALRASNSDSENSSPLKRRFSNASSDMPDLASINEQSAMESVGTPPYVATGRNLMAAREYRGGVPPSTGIGKVASLRQKFERVSSSGRLGVVSASGDVFTDDVSQYSFSRFFADANETKSEEDLANAPAGDSVISTKSAGDLQLVGKTVHFLDSSDSSSESQSSESDDITIDSGLNRDAQQDVSRLVPQTSMRSYPQGKKTKRKKPRAGFGSRIKKKIGKIRERGKCVSHVWFCENPKRYNDIPTGTKRLQKYNSRQCLLHDEDSPYDRTHVMEPSRLTIDDKGFMVRRR